MITIAYKKIWLMLISIVVLGVCGTARADEVALGSDYFQTQPGTSFNFGGPIGVVNFKGKPTGPGNTDTIMQRQADATIGGGSIPIQLVDLSLQSTAPVNIGGNFFDVFVTLDPANLNKDIGQMTIMGNLGGGTFDSFFDVFFDAHFVPTGVGLPFDVFSSLTISQTGAMWGPTPTASTLIVPGPDCDLSRETGLPCDPAVATLDQAANMHSFFNDPSEVDFFVVGTIHQGPHPVTNTQVPEPGTLLLLGTGLAALGSRVRKRRSRKA